MKGASRMFVGYLRKPNKPSLLAKLLSITCKNQGIELVYMRPEDISTKTGTVKGKMYINNSWVPVETPIPSFIDVNPHYFNSKRYTKVMNYLKTNTKLSIDQFGIIQKGELQQKLKENKKLKQVAIPTKELTSFEDIESYIDKYQTIVIKPVKGLRGKNVLILRRSEDKFTMGLQKEAREISKEDLLQFYNNELKDRKYIIQKCISSRTLEGDPFDCRIHLEKNGKGKWAVARMFFRIGIGQKVVSNINQGGGISDPKPFLKSNFGQKWEMLNKGLKNLAYTLPYEIERIENKTFTTMGLDVGIDNDGGLYLFEINSFPVVTPQLSKVALLRAEYFKYVLKDKKRRISKR